MAKKFDIPKQSFSSVADAYNGLLGMDNNRVVNLPVSQLDEIDNQPFPINDVWSICPYHSLMKSTISRFL